MKILLLIVLLSSSVFANVKKIPSTDYKLDTVGEFDGVVWGFDFLTEDQALITLRSGEFYHYNLKTKKKVSLPTPKVKSLGQGGLLDVKVYSTLKKSYIYLTFSESVSKMVVTSLARGEWVKGELKNLKTLFRSQIQSTTGRHFGSRLLIFKGQIFMTVGDRGARDLAQDLNSHQGKILRLDLEGKPMEGNPFVKKGLPEIWSYGHRNPQGIDIDPQTREVYSVEFGPKGGDELNAIYAGKNYGWPIITYGREYYGPKIGTTQKEGMEQPVTYWVPSISPSGMAFYTGEKIKEWQYSLFLANLSSRHLRRLVLKKGKVILEENLFSDLRERIRHVATGTDGHLYFSTDSGKLIKISSKDKKK